MLGYLKMGVVLLCESNAVYIPLYVCSDQLWCGGYDSENLWEIPTVQHPSGSSGKDPCKSS